VPNIWIFSDPHIGHDRLVEKGYRPEGHDDLLIKRTIETVRPGDLAICLGDLSIGAAKEEKAKQFARDLSQKACPYGRTVLVRGNHDSKSASWFMKNGWDLCCDAFELDMYGVHWLFVHEPRPADQVPEGTICVHGHCHANEHREMVDSQRHILIAAEHLDYRPISLERLSALRKTPVYQKGSFVDLKKDVNS
jgi:calcineurin-like phosphoesterase family protein